ncbi:MAG: hypothetical protein AVDCRST_MAG59-1677, partial [uncultured Thermomicrobiales bacterium]
GPRGPGPPGRAAGYRAGDGAGPLARGVGRAGL